jgi:outer membrane murein-binding lipoprotein Lpp
MKRKSLILAALAIATLVTGCNNSNTADQNPAASDTGSLSVTQQLQKKQSATHD